jgi:hypothetical protein
MARRTRATEDTAKKREQVVQLRRTRLSFAEIGRQLDITGQRAGQLYREALADVPAQAVEEHRVEELELIDTAVNQLMEITADGAVSPRTRVEAWSAIRAWADRKSKLLGLDSPTQIDATVTEVTQEDIELSEMIREAKARSDATEAQIKASAGTDPAATSEWRATHTRDGAGHYVPRKIYGETPDAQEDLR